MRQIAAALAVLGLAGIGYGQKHLGPVTALASHAAGMLGCSQAGVLRHDVHKPGEKQALVCRPAFRVFGLVSLGKQGVLVAGGQPGRTGLVQVWRGKDAAKAVRVGNDVVYRLAVAADHRRAALAMADGRVLLVTLPGVQKRRVLFRHTAPCRDVCFVDGGRRVVSAGRDGVLASCAVDIDKKARRFLVDDHTAGVECLALSADGKLLLSGAQDGKVRMHKMAKDGALRLVRTWQRLGRVVNAVQWHGAGVCVGLADGRLLQAKDSTSELTLLRSLATPIYALAVQSNSLQVGLRGSVRFVSLP